MQEIYSEGIQCSMSSSDTKLAILENKVSMYEKMIEKLDSAIEKISESNATITKMLAVHDEKIDNTIKSDQFIVEMIKKIESESDEDKVVLSERIHKVEEQVDELSRFKWMALGIVTIVAFFVTNISSLASGWLTNNQESSRIEIQENLNR